MLALYLDPLPDEDASEHPELGDLNEEQFIAWCAGVRDYVGEKGAEEWMKRARAEWEAARAEKEADASDRQHTE